MNNRFAAAILIGGIGLLAASIPRGHRGAPSTRRAHQTERPWLTREAQAELIGEHGAPGPLFAGVTLGGPDPSTAQRAAIAAFAKQHALDIQLEVHDDTLVAIRASVTFGGCCGYEAVDMIGRRVQRPYLYPCCDCGEGNPVDDWAFEPEPGVHARFHTHVNTLSVRWEAALSTEEALAAADDLIGRPVDRVKRHAGDRITELEPHEYVLELPYDDTHPQEGTPRFGVHVSSHAGAVSEVSFELRDDAGVEVTVAEGVETPLQKLLRARWGRPHIDAETGEWSWHRADRVITATADFYRANVTIERIVDARVASRQ